ncbi:Piso0_003943 [Millerozyma farinosa CBS 7064]|uniref:Piso0_003943 protein n=1 Tax=Pichia sorbitophila (strain ATCC MYA-4447 / BCRC 22081 / CBS 7064 / NBRC 10061 / NRRL Y-12695) TaxID=559304 RepID=G8Y9Y5_PICSO|nr:Piso0_003943 [Millerozyma farinosa CBS 7064]CCE84399.1 Piso0_003943 [Millerozyma farinosa CBS 7064]
MPPSSAFTRSYIRSLFTATVYVSISTFPCSKCSSWLFFEECFHDGYFSKDENREKLRNVKHSSFTKEPAEKQKWDKKRMYSIVACKVRQKSAGNVSHMDRSSR